MQQIKFVDFSEQKERDLVFQNDNIPEDRVVCCFPPCIVDQMCHLRRDSHKRTFRFGRVGLEILQQERSIDGKYPCECFLVELQEAVVASAESAITFRNMVDQVAEFDWLDVLLHSLSGSKLVVLHLEEFKPLVMVWAKGYYLCTGPAQSLSTRLAPDLIRLKKKKIRSNFFFLI